MEKYLKVLVDFLESQDWLEDESEFALLQNDLVDQMEADYNYKSSIITKARMLKIPKRYKLFFLVLFFCTRTYLNRA